MIRLNTSVLYSKIEYDTDDCTICNDCKVEDLSMWKTVNSVKSDLSDDMDLHFWILSNKVNEMGA